MTRKPKINTMEAHHTSNPWTYSDVKRSRSPGRLMLTQQMHNGFWKERPTNFKLGKQTEHEDPYHRQAPWIQRSRSQGHVMRLRLRRERNVLEIPNLLGYTHMGTSFKVKGQGHHVDYSWQLTPEVRHIFWKERPYKLETWYTDGVRRLVSPTSAMTTKVKV